ncbi:hypothetical protein MCP1_3970002 [Candidatus Terasakiella magnetica]|nr:hypothetical protein MCP1_3970002 [Candidatus Terasakiella magnetica]
MFGTGSNHFHANTLKSLNLLWEQRVFSGSKA